MMIWLSFSDPSRPMGFLGVVIVEIEADRFDPASLALALIESHRAGLNPGGEVQASLIPPEDEARFRPFTDRLLTRSECEAIGERVAR